jgi:uncharacterized protein YndB with AHSA1/START domain
MDHERLKRIVWTIHVNAPLKSVYAAVSTAEGLRGWMPMEAVLTDTDGNELPPGRAASVGDRFRFAWHIGHSEEGEFLEAEDDGRVRYSFGEATEVTVTLEETDDGTVLVTLEQDHDRGDDMNLKMMLGYGPGWAFYITNLKSVLEGGLDLRDFSHETEHMINY